MTADPARMQLFITPGACCLGAHVVARELDLPVDIVKVPLRTPGSPIHAVNPLGRVPALRLADGEVITENSAILPYLADLKPEGGLYAPAGSVERAKIQAWIGYINSEIHAASFRPINRPERYSNDASAHDGIRRRGREQLKTALGHLDRRLKDRPFLEGGWFTIADAYLGVFVRWIVPLGDEFADLEALARFRTAYNERPSVRAALAAEAEA
jgi:glutathione S-transferase